MIDYGEPAGVAERWQPELDRIAPQTERGHSTLLLRWEPGEEWAPVGRWVIWEVMRPDMAPTIVQPDLEGPNPRSFGYYDRSKRRFVRERTLSVTRQQWQFHADTGLYGRTVWVCQGGKGGHKRFWSDVEQNLAYMTYSDDWEVLGIAPGDLQPPAPGELPYAEPDERTIAALRALDLVHRFGDVLRHVTDYQERTDMLDRREKSIAEEMARQLWYWLDDQVGETLDLITRAQAQEVWDYADPDLPMPDYEQGHQQFIEEVAGAAGF